jgi:hypothetical protein
MPPLHKTLRIFYAGFSRFSMRGKRGKLLKIFTAPCAKTATYVAKMEFNTGIETLTIFLVSIVAAGHGRALFSARWKPGGPRRGMDPQT